MAKNTKRLVKEGGKYERPVGTETVGKIRKDQGKGEGGVDEDDDEFLFSEDEDEGHVDSDSDVGRDTSKEWYENHSDDEVPSAAEYGLWCDGLFE